MACLVVFVVGSAPCSFAPTSSILIIGRAIAGLGSAGMFPGTVIIGARIFRLEKRILLMALGGLTMSTASIVGPLLDGALTTAFSWRLCFIINSPLGGILLLAVCLALKLAPSYKAELEWRQQLVFLVFLGALLLLGTATMLFFALHFVSAGQAFADRAVVVLLSGSGLATMLLVSWLWIRGESAIVPLHLLRNRTVASACIMAVGLYGGLTAALYYLLEYFQAVKGVSAYGAGKAIIPYLLATALSSILVAILATKTCLPNQTAIALSVICGCALAVVGGSSMTITKHTTNGGAMIAIQIVFGWHWSLYSERTEFATICPSHGRLLHCNGTLVIVPKLGRRSRSGDCQHGVHSDFTRSQARDAGRDQY